MIQAKPVVADQYWILTEGDSKVGELQARDDGYSLSFNGTTQKFSSISLLGRSVNIKFSPAVEKLPVDPTRVYGYPAIGPVFNPVWDVRRRLPLYTKDETSKSWMAAGWYQIKQHRAWKTVCCPKLIVLDRYQYRGPFETKQEIDQ
jgi:hypothetical protein